MIPVVSHKVLTQQLRALELNGIVSRERLDKEMTVAYALTELGLTLRTSLAALASWGQKHHQELGVELDWRP
jgi:DNA-binding HxlR family transcriptional regulator